MLQNKLLVSFIISTLISGVYYYINENYYEEEDRASMGTIMIVFVATLISLYLLQIGYLKRGDVSVESNTISGGDYRPPF